MANLKQKLSVSSCIGIFSKTVDSSFVEVAGLAGLDFIVLDMEHGPASYETLVNHVRAAKLTAMSSVIRVKGLDAHAIGSALDTGADAVQVPNINTAEQARLAVNAARYHPLGNRGVCRFVRAAEFGSMDRDDYFSSSNEKSLILQVEGTEGIANIDAILNVAGYDVLFIGPYDLSQSLGIPGQVEAPEVLAMMREISSKAAAKGIKLGAFSDNIARSRALLSEGFDYIAYSVDVNIYLQAVAGLVKGMNDE